MNEHPKISIVVPTYNRENYLKECLDSIINQNYPNLEIVVTDDNSTDNTEIIAKEYIKKYPFIKYVKNRKYPQGPNGNKNNGLDNATGEVFGIFDDDDILLEGALNLLIAKMTEGYDMVMANCVRSDNGKFSGHGVTQNREIKWQDYMCGKTGGEFWSIFKKDMIGDKRFDTDLIGGEGILWRGIMKNRKIYYLHKAVRLYRIHGSSISDNTINNAKKIVKNYEKDIEYYGDDMKKYCSCYLSTIYKGAAYFARLANEYQKGLKYLIVSIKLCPKYKTPYIMFGLFFMPKKLILFLIKLRIKFEKD